MIPGSPVNSPATTPNALATNPNPAVNTLKTAPIAPTIAINATIAPTINPIFMIVS